MKEHKIFVRDLKVNYKTFGLPAQSGPPAEAGEGRPMLIFPGWRSNSERWVKVAEILAQNNIRVIVPDLPGFGKSEEPKTAWSIDDYVEWAREFTELVPELKDSFYLLGHSFGGTLAAKFTIKYNQKVSRLFLVSASSIRIKTPSKKAAYNFSRIVKLFYFIPYYELFRKFIYKYVIRKSDYAYVSGIMRDIYLKVIADDLSHKINFIKVPTILIWGDKDDLTPIEHANIMTSKIPGSKLVVIPGAKHNLNIMIPDVLAQKVLENL